MSDSPTLLDLPRYTVLANPQSTLNLPQVDDAGELRRVGCFMVVDESKRVVGFRADDAPDLSPSFKLFTDGECTEELLSVEPDEGESWCVQRSGSDVGRLVPRTRGLTAQRWRVEDGSGQIVAELDDVSLGGRLKRRYRRAQYRENWRLAPTAGGAPTFLLRDPVAAAYVLRVVGPEEPVIDRALTLAAAVCVPTLEGLTAFLRPDFKRFEG